MWGLRSLLVAIGLARAVALIARGNVIIGVLVGAATLERATILMRWHLRRQESHRRTGQRRTDFR